MAIPKKAYLLSFFSRHYHKIMKLKCKAHRYLSLLGFTLGAKLVSSKHLTQSPLENLKSHFRKLGFTPDDKVYHLSMLKYFRSKSKIEKNCI